MKIISYKDWKKLLAEADRKIVCLDCKGSGNRVCGECGGDTDCLKCEGEGAVLETDLSYENLHCHRTRYAYLQAIKKDLGPIKYTLPGFYLNTLIESNLAPYSNINTKILHFGEPPR